MLAGCGGSGHGAGQQQLAAGSSRPPDASSATASADPTSAAARLSASDRQALRSLNASLNHALQKAGPASGAMVYDLSKRAPLYEVRIDTPRLPASVEKLYTSAATLRDLGPNMRLQTTVLGAGHLGPGGVWHGDLYLRGDGDPTFGDSTFNRVWNHGFGSTSEALVAQLTRAGIHRVTGRLYGDASLFDSQLGGSATNYGPDIPDYGGELAGLTYDHGTIAAKMTPGAFAAHEVSLVMRSTHISVRAAPKTAVTPPTAVPLAAVASPPLATMLKLMNVPSDDLFAEMLTEQLGTRFGGGGSIEAGAGVISQAIAEQYGVHPRIEDGSGLSRADRSSPVEIVDLLRGLWHTPIGDQIDGTLPVVGETGTTQTIATRTAAQGNCIAKTGTLNTVTNLAGYCNSRSGQTLAFALMIDGPDNAQAIWLEGMMVAAIARF